MLSRMSSVELAEWMAFDTLEPIGELRGDVRTGIVASLIYNVNRGKDMKPLAPIDFMPYQNKQDRQE